MDIPLYQNVLEEVVKQGVTEFCLCPGSRNSPFVNCLMKSSQLVKHFWYEERSAAFFALGRARATGKPVAVITTSGTAAGELLPAAMEAYYTGTPVLLITADRPRRFRGTGAPQTAEQEKIFGVYTPFAQDMEADEICRIREWDRRAPAQLNVCLEDPKSYPAVFNEVFPEPKTVDFSFDISIETVFLDEFFQRSMSPLVIVSALSDVSRPAVIDFLIRMQAPIYCEAASGLREDPRLDALQIRTESMVWELSKRNSYEIDGVLRLGGIPVTRIWRDLEDRSHQLAECSLSSVPFSGLSWGRHIQCTLEKFLPSYPIPYQWMCRDFFAWSMADREHQKNIHALLESEPTSEPSIYRALAAHIPENALVYLGNSLPVREWDLAASVEARGFDVQMNRGLNGIDGQISTFLGLCRPGRENWGIFGDLTALYDFAALWILKDLPKMAIKIVVINNNGGKLFSRMYKDPVFQNVHQYDFEYFAKSWKIPYFLETQAVASSSLPEQAFLEICPDPAATDRFWSGYDSLSDEHNSRIRCHVNG